MANTTIDTQLSRAEWIGMRAQLIKDSRLILPTEVIYLGITLNKTVKRLTEYNFIRFLQVANTREIYSILQNEAILRIDQHFVVTRLYNPQGVEVKVY